MTKINFYRIGGGLEDALNLACQLAEKATQQSMSVLFHAEQEVADKLSQLLWSFKPTAFLPHAKTTADTGKITITSDDDPGEHHGLLVSLKAETPNWFSRFEKAAEIVYDDQYILTKKRDSFRHYKSRGYPLNYIDLTEQAS